MKIILAADGSNFTKKALAFLVTHPELLGSDGQVVVLHVQMPVPPRVTTMAGAATVHQYQKEEAEKVLAPIEEFLQRHELPFTTRWIVGHAATEILAAAGKEHAHLILMGTHGHGLLGRVLMGSVALNVVTGSDIPVMLVK